MAKSAASLAAMFADRHQPLCLPQHHPAILEKSKKWSRRSKLAPIPQLPIRCTIAAARFEPNAHAHRFDATVGQHIGVISRWTSTAERTASTTLANSASRPSPVVLTMAAVLGDLVIDEFAPVRLQPGERFRLVGFHQPAVSGDIGRRNGPSAVARPVRWASPPLPINSSRRVAPAE
jgi:hypothetical protein